MASRKEWVREIGTFGFFAVTFGGFFGCRGLRLLGAGPVVLHPSVVASYAAIRPLASMVWITNYQARIPAS